MRASALMLCLLLASLASSPVLAEACYVTSRSSSDAIVEVEKELCYEFVGMSEGAIDWSCSNESTDMISSQQEKVMRCAEGSIGRCEAALTQESLANYRSTGPDQEQNRPAVPNDAKVITRYYSSDDANQLRIDCESAGGTWQAGEKES